MTFDVTPYAKPPSASHPHVTMCDTSSITLYPFKRHAFCDFVFINLEQVTIFCREPYDIGSCINYSPVQIDSLTDMGSSKTGWILKVTCDMRAR